MNRLLPLGLVTFTILTIFLVYRASNDNLANLSSQGCRMSWMSPSYLLQSDFNHSWTTLSSRYSLWLYREVGWDASGVHDGNPMLFITGNAGSSHQARSIASSAARQFYESPGYPNPAFRGLRPVDVFAVEFNEDLSALHGPTIESQREYVSSAISYILSTYNGPRRKITIVGHSMGGIVARSLFASSHAHDWNVSDIAAVITMSTPHSLAPARFDRSIEKIYSDIAAWENSDLPKVPTLSICGGSTDALIPSETCALPSLRSQHPNNSDFRSTVHTTSLPGVWTGVGHREMAWCHQVRWRVARVALELGALTPSHDRPPATAPEILESWFPSGDDRSDLATPNLSYLDLSMVPHTRLAKDEPMLTLPSSPTSPHVYLIPIPADATLSHKFTIQLARGILVHPPTSLQQHIYHPSTFEVKIYHCLHADLLKAACSPVETLGTPESRLIPLPVNSERFPGEEGIDESEGVLFWRGRLNVGAPSENKGWIAVHVEGGGEGWLVAGFVEEGHVIAHTTTYGLITGAARFLLSDNTPSGLEKGFPLRTTITLPNVLSHALLVYRVHVSLAGRCDGSTLLRPLAHHTSAVSVSDRTHQFSDLQPRESHFHLATSQRPIYIHSHVAGPFVPSTHAHSTVLQVYTSGPCGVSDISIDIDWRSSLGRAGSRYWSMLGVWCVGVVGILVAGAWREWDLGDGFEPFPHPVDTLLHFTVHQLPWFSLALTSMSLLPLPSYILLGNGGTAIFAPLAGICVILATGLVWAMWGVLSILLYVLGRVKRILGSREEQPSGEHPISRTVLVGSALSLLLVAWVIPFQVVYLILFLRHLWRCSSLDPITTTPVRRRPGWKVSDDFGPSSPTRAQNLYVLLLMSWLLPLVAPVLAVWVRTLVTAGITTPFRGDHNILDIMFFLGALEYFPLCIERSEKLWIGLLTQGMFYLLPGYAFFFGGRYSYGVYSIANVLMGLVIMRRIMSKNSHQ